MNSICIIASLSRCSLVCVCVCVCVCAYAYAYACLWFRSLRHCCYRGLASPLVSHGVHGHVDAVAAPICRYDMMCARTHTFAHSSTGRVTRLLGLFFARSVLTQPPAQAHPHYPPISTLTSTATTPTQPRPCVLVHRLQLQPAPVP
jgi:hypothetical protein